jgi:hypothetical protein
MLAAPTLTHDRPIPPNPSGFHGGIFHHPLYLIEIVRRILRIPYFRRKKVGITDYRKLRRTDYFQSKNWTTRFQSDFQGQETAGLIAVQI